MRRRLLALSAATYAAIFVLFLVLERPGLGIGHGFYVSILLAAIATGPITGAAAGVFATLLYSVGVVVNPHLPPTEVPTVATAIRMVTYVLVGTMVGYYARTNRRLMGGAYDLVEELTVLAKRDRLTALPNTRAFETAVTRMLDEKRPFALLVADAVVSDNARAVNVLDVADRLQRYLLPGDELARIGDLQFAVLTSASADPAAAGTRLERALGADGVHVTFGWSTYPRDGDNALALFRAADERLYARKIVRGEWQPTAEASGSSGDVRPLRGLGGPDAANAG